MPPVCPIPDDGGPFVLIPAAAWETFVTIVVLACILATVSALVDFLRNP